MFPHFKILLKIVSFLACCIFSCKAQLLPLNGKNLPGITVKNIPAFSTIRMLDSLSAIKKNKAGFGFVNPQFDSLSARDLPPAVKSAFTSFVNTHFGNTEATRIKSLLSTGDPRMLMNQLLHKKIQSVQSFMGGFHKLANPGFLGNPTLAVHAEGMVTSSGSATRQYQGNLYIAGNTSIAGIRFNLQSNYAPQNNLPGSNGRNFHVKFTYDRDGFLRSMKKNIQQQYSLNAQFLKDVNIENYMNKFTHAAMLSRFKGFQNDLPAAFRQILKDSLHFQQLMQFDSSQIITFLADQHLSLNQAQMDSFSTSFLKLRDSLSAEKLEINRIAKYQQALDNTAFKVLDDAKAGDESIRKLVRLSGIQRIFLQMRDFKLGSFSPDFNRKLNPEPILSNGVNMAFSKLLSGLNFDAGFFRNAVSGQNLLSDQFLNGGSTRFAASSFNTVMNGKISLMQSFKTSADQLVPVLSKNSMAITMSQQFDLRKWGDISADISKSATSYNNTAESSSLQVLQRKNALNHLGEDFWQTLALNVRHEIIVSDRDFSAATTIKVAGLGYQSPLSNGLHASKWELGTRLKKSFLHRRLVVNARYNMRDITYSLNKNQALMNYAYQLDGRFRYARSVTFTLRWLGNQTMQQSAAGALKLYGLTKIEAGSNINYHIGALSSTLNASGGMQKIQSAGFLTSPSTSLTTTLSNILVISKLAISLSAFANKEISGSKVIGDLINTDLSVQYPLANNVSLNTAGVFLYNASVAKQLGVRQGCQLGISSKISVSGYVDLRANLMQNAYPWLYSNCRGNVSMVYNLN